MLLILYIVIGFGIFSTVVMMTTERRKEFRMVISLGMRRGRLAVVTVIEAVCIALTGATGRDRGIVSAGPLAAFSSDRPGRGIREGDAGVWHGAVLPFSVDPVVFWAQGAIVAGLGIVSSVYPVFVVRQTAKN